jgi:hypothetical protein
MRDGIPRAREGWPRTILSLYPRENEGRNICSGDWYNGGTGGIENNEPTCIQIYNICISTKT